MFTLHNILDMASVLLGFSIFFITWHGNISNNGHKLKIVSFAILCASALSLAHLCSYTSTADGARTYHNWVFWLSARILWSGALFYRIYTPGDQERKIARIVSYSIFVSIFIIISDASALGITQLLSLLEFYKQTLLIFSLCTALLLNFLALYILYRHFSSYTAGTLLQAGLWFDVITNACLVVEVSTFSQINIAAHVFNLFTYYYFLRSVFYYVIKKPYQHLISLKEQMEELAAKNAQLYKESEEQRNLVEDILAKIGAILSSQLNLKDTLDAIANMAADMMHSRQSIIALLSSDQSNLQVVASYGINTPPTCLPLSRSLGNKVIEENRALFLGNLDIHPDIFRPQLIFSNINSLICTPLVNDGQIIGIIEAYSSESNAYIQKDALLLTAIGHYAGAAIASAMLYEETKLRLEEERFLSDIAHDAAATIDIETIMKLCTGHVVEALNADTGIGFLINRNPDQLNMAAAVNFSYKLTTIELKELPKLNSLIQNLKPTTATADIFPPLAELYDQNATRHVMILPVALDSALLGLIIVGWQRFIPPERLNRLTFASLMTQQIALGLEKARLYNQVKSMALSDGLTGLANRRNFDMFLNTELRRAASLKRPLSLIMLDLDKFKNYNDTYGHLTGDKLLAQIGQILHHNVRSIDLPARYGGEEFSVILPECGSAEAAVLAEKLRAAVEQGQFPDNVGTFSAYITASIGVATYDPAIIPAAPDAEQLISISDKALYNAKQNGRNQVVTAAILE